MTAPTIPRVLTPEEWAAGPQPLAPWERFQRWHAIDVDRYQNPLYPRDAHMSIEDMNVVARRASMWRARSPGERICKIDDVSSRNEPLHGHEREIFMDYRYNHVIGAQDPWVFWWLFDQWAMRQKPAEPLPRPPLEAGWRRRAPPWLPGMTGWSHDWQGNTFATLAGPSRFLPGGPGMRTRITLVGTFSFESVYIGPVSSRRWVAEDLHQLTFSGFTFSQTGAGPEFTAVSDPLPFGIDASNGIMVSAYVSGPSPFGGPNVSLGTRGAEPDWYSRWIVGNRSSDRDKSRLDMWTETGQAVLALHSIEAWYERQAGGSWEPGELPPGWPPDLPPLQPGWAIRYFGGSDARITIGSINTQWSFATLVPPSRFLTDAGDQTRVTLNGACTFSDLHIGPASTTQWVAQELIPMTFNGGNTDGVCDGWITTDVLPQGIEAPNGLIVSGYVKLHPSTPPVQPVIGARSSEMGLPSRPGWLGRVTAPQSVMQPGNLASALDKRQWRALTAATLGVEVIEVELPEVEP